MSAERPPIPWLAAIGHGVVVSLFAVHVAPPVIALPAFFGGAAGAIYGTRLAASDLRTAMLPIVAAIPALLALLLDRLLTHTSTVALAVGPAAAERFAEAAIALGVGGAFSASTRAMSRRIPSALGLELGALALIILRMLVDHRFGAVNRPFTLADPLLAIGRDPKVAFLLAGAFAAMVGASLLLRERSRLRAAYHLLALLFLASFCLGSSAVGVLPGTAPSAAARREREREQRERREEEERRARGDRGGSGDREGGRSGGSGNRRRVVAVVLFHDDFSPPSETYYFRSGAYTRFAGPRLVESTEPDVPVEFPSARTQLPAVPGEGFARETLETTVAMVSGHPNPIALEAPLALWPVENSDPTRFTRVDRVRSAVLAWPLEEFLGRPVGDSTWDPARDALLRAPHPDPRYAELAHAIVEELLPEGRRTEPVAQAFAINAWLAREGVYSKRHLGEDMPDPATTFLFGERIGYCVHFANAAVHLYRALGIPSRVAVGFAMPEQSRQGGSSLLVTDDFGHAWPEVYVEGVGWVVFDLAAERSLDPPPTPADVELTRLLAELVRGEPPPTEVPEPPDVAAAVAAVLDHADEAGYGAAGLLAVLVLVLYVTKLARRYGYLVAPRGALPRAVYRSLADRLAELGHRRHRGETREAFAVRVAATVPAAVAITAVHVSAAFGGRAHDARIDELRPLLAQGARDLRARTPLGRRALAFLDPVSFLTAR